MVMSFFKKGPSGLEHVETRAIAMLADARHSFDLATIALLTGSLPESIAEDIRATDHRINQSEQDLRTELVVHVSVHGTFEIATVMGFILLLKKIERIGDQAKNILDLAEAGISLAEGAEAEDRQAERTVVSNMFGEAGELLSEHDPSRVADFAERAKALTHAHQDRIDSYLHSDRPGSEVVPRAIYDRYLKRIVANLLGIVGTATEPLPHIDYLDGGKTDITDD